MQGHCGPTQLPLKGAQGASGEQQKLSPPLRLLIVTTGQNIFFYCITEIYKKAKKKYSTVNRSLTDFRERTIMCGGNEITRQLNHGHLFVIIISILFVFIIFFLVCESSCDLFYSILSR